MLISFFAYSDVADAAAIMQKTGSNFGTTTITNGLVKTTLTGNVKHIKHAKYTDAAMKNMTAYKQMSSGGKNFTAFAYNCPGYYLTRIYSDAQGTKLVGVIQIYVKEFEVGSAATCEGIEEPPTPTPAPVTTKVNVTHPLPQKTETNNMTLPTAPTPETPIEGIATDPPPQPPVPRPPQTVEEKIVACQEASLGNDFQALVKQKSTGYYACVDMEKCNPSNAVDGQLNWYCYNGNVDEITYVNRELPWEQEPEPDVTSRTVYSVDDCGESGVDECGITLNQLLPDGTPCTTCSNVISPEEPEEPEEPEQPQNPVNTPSFPAECEEDPTLDGCPPPCYCYDLNEWGYLCCVFDCPGMDAVMNDFKSFIAFEAIGTAIAPEVPHLPTPNIPNIFDVLNNVDERNPTKPTGTEAPAFGANTFDANDVKNEAINIPFIQDDTGGFKIDNPLETLDDNLADPPMPEGELETLNYPTSATENEAPNSNKNNIERPDAPNNERLEQPKPDNERLEQPKASGSLKYPGT